MFEYTEKSYQRETINYGIKNPYIINALEQGLGKAQPLDATIQTPSGPKLMGELVVGDHVFGVSGTPKKILGVYPQGIKKVFKVSFSDGSSTECCDEHLWNVQLNKEYLQNKGFRTIQLSDLKNSLRNKYNWRWRIPICSPVKYPKREDIVIPPYLMGVLLGDGSLNDIRSVSITNASDQIYERLSIDILEMGLDPIRHEDKNSYTIRALRRNKLKRNPLNEEIEKLGLNKTSHGKFVPNKYLYSCVEDRINILAGLLDTDGYVSKTGTIQYSSASKILVEHVGQLVRSIGGTYNGINYKKTNIGTDSWYITIKIPNDIKVITKLFKSERVIKDNKYKPCRYIVAVEEAGVKECQCISVEDSLYLTDDYIVTHNTLTAIRTAVETNSKAFIICPSYLKLKWVSEINKFAPGSIVSLLENEKDIYPLWDTDFAIMSYSFIDKAELIFEWADMVIPDEAHFLKNMKAKRTESFHKHVYENSIKRVNLLTGTPILNRVHEFYSLISICQYNPTVEESAFLKKFPTYVDFANHFSYLKEFEIKTKRGLRTVQQWEGHQNVDELHSWLKNIYIRFEADKVLDLPPFIEIDVPVKYDDNPELEEAFNTFQAHAENSSVQSAIKAKAAIAKAPYTAEYVQNLLDQDVQVVVYSDHPEAAALIAKKLGVAHIDGTTKNHIRQMQADEFQAGRKRVIVATIGSFSTGIDLFSACNMVFNDPNWVPGQMKQVMARIRRIGQVQRCIFHKIIGSYQDHVIYEKIKMKEKTIKAVVV